MTYYNLTTGDSYACETNQAKTNVLLQLLDNQINNWVRVALTPEEAADLVKRLQQAIFEIEILKENLQTIPGLDSIPELPALSKVETVLDALASKPAPEQEIKDRP